jgi:HSP20 family molecular chaperone IbpA
VIALKEDEIMDEKQPVTRTEQRPADTPSLLPRVDVFEDGTGITLLADLPGVPKDKLTLRVEGDTLQIEGDITPETPENMAPVYAELRLPRYRRAFTLSAELNTEQINAQFRDGVLTLRIPKHAHAQPRRIEIKVA